MGVLRLLLAIGVVLSHVGGSILAYAFTPGDASVQCFFIISGFLMAMIWRETYSRVGEGAAPLGVERSARPLQAICLFYSNRFLRIFAPYLVVLAAALVIAMIRYAMAGAGPIAAWKAASNRLAIGDWLYLVATSIALVGQDLTLFLRMSPAGLQWTADFHPSFPRVYQMMLVPQAWSLSLELMFYLMVPFLVRRSWVIVAAVLAASLGARWWAYDQGYDGDPWSYRFFPFELALFLAGVLSWRLAEVLRSRSVGPIDAAVGIAVIALVVLFARYDDRSLDFFGRPRLMLYGGLALGLPFLFRASTAIRLDRAIGDLSYPLYLTHELVASLVPAAGLGPDQRAGVVIAIALVVSWLLVRFLEAPVDAFRHHRLARALPLRA